MNSGNCCDLLEVTEATYHLMDADSPHDRALSRRHGRRGRHGHREVLARADPWRDIYLDRLAVVLGRHKCPWAGAGGNHDLDVLLSLGRRRH